MASLYDELGTEPSADQEQLRRAYRARARQLHPDLHPDLNRQVADTAGDDSAMQRLNAAWAVLGDPVARDRYDRQLRDDAAAAQPRPSEPSPTRDSFPVSGNEPDLGAWGGLVRLLRPSVIIPVVLFGIFVITAYAGHPGTSGTAPLQPSPTTTANHGPVASIVGTTAPAVTVPAAAFVGKCIRDQAGGPVLIVACSDRPNSLVIATVPIGGGCPSGTASYALSGQTEMVCASPTGP